MEHLKRLNHFRLDAERNFNELVEIRDKRMNSISRIDSKIDDYYNIINAIRTEMNLLIVNGEVNISVDVLNLHDAEDNQVLMAKIDIPGFPSIYKSFFGMTYSLFKISENDKSNNFSILKRINALAIDWLMEKEEYAGLFNHYFNNANEIIDSFINDESVLNYLKRGPFKM